MYLIVYGFNKFVESHTWDAKSAIVEYYECAGGHYKVNGEMFAKMIKSVSVEEAVEMCNALLNEDDAITAIFSNVMVTFDSRKKAE